MCVSVCVCVCVCVCVSSWSGSLVSSARGCLTVPSRLASCSGFLRTPSLIVLESHSPLETEYSQVLLSSGVSAIPAKQLVLPYTIILKATKLEVGNHAAQSPGWIYQCHHSGLYLISLHLVGFASPQVQCSRQPFLSRVGHPPQILV